MAARPVGHRVSLRHSERPFCHSERSEESVAPVFVRDRNTPSVTFGDSSLGEGAKDEGCGFDRLRPQNDGGERSVQNPFLFPAGKRNGFWNPKKKGLLRIGALCGIWRRLASLRPHRDQPRPLRPMRAEQGKAAFLSCCRLCGGRSGVVPWARRVVAPITAPPRRGSCPAQPD